MAANPPNRLQHLKFAPAHISLCIIFLGLAAYINSLFGSFVYDDFSIIVDNPLIRTARNLPLLFSTSYWELQTSVSQTNLNYYRPLTMLSYALNYLLHGPHAFGFHLVNVTLHIAVSILLFRLLLRLQFSMAASALSALIFVALPVHTEAVSSIVGRAEVLVVFFLLIAWHMNIGKSSYLKTAAGLGCFLFALLSKESAACFPLVLVLSDCYRTDLPFKETAKKYAPTWALYLTVLGFYFEWRRLILGTFFPVTTAPYFTDQSLLIRTLTVARFLFEGYARPLVSGRGLYADYMRPTYPDATTLDAGAWIALTAIGAVVGMALWRFFRRKSATAFAILLFFAFYLPVSNLFLNIAYVIGAERFIYSASIGFCLLAGICLEKALIKWRISTILLMAGLLVMWTALTVRRNKDWKDPAAFFTALIRDNQRNPTGWNGLGTLYEDRGLHSKARSYYLKALELSPSMTSAIFNIAGTYYQEKDFSNAEEWFHRCTSGNAMEKDALTFLGLIEMEKKDLPGALLYFRQAAQLYPTDPAVRQNLAVLLDMTKQK